MALQQIQEEVDEWVEQYEIGYWQPHEMLARLTEEVGEVAREINHLYGPKKKKATEKDNELADELADIIFTVTCIANSQDINLDEAFSKVMDKCYGRDKNRFKKKSD